MKPRGQHGLDKGMLGLGRPYLDFFPQHFHQDWEPVVLVENAADLYIPIGVDSCFVDSLEKEADKG